MDFRTSGHISPSSSLRVTTPTNPLLSPVLSHPVPVHLASGNPIPPHLPGLLYYPGLPLGNRNLPVAVPPNSSPIAALSNSKSSAGQLQPPGITSRTATVPPLPHLPHGNHVSAVNPTSSVFVNPSNLPELRSSPASSSSTASTSSSSFAAALRILAKQAGGPNCSTESGNLAEREVEEIGEVKKVQSASSSACLPSPRPHSTSMSKSASPSTLYPPYRHSSRTSPVNLSCNPSENSFSHSSNTAVTKATEAVQGRLRSPPPVVTIAPTPSLVGMYNHERKGLERPPISSIAGSAGLSTGLSFPPYGHPHPHPPMSGLNLPPHGTPEHYQPWPPFAYPYSQDILRNMAVAVATSGASVRMDEPLFSMAGNNYMDNSLLSSVVTSRPSILPQAQRAEDYFLGAARHGFMPFRPDLHYGNDPIHNAMMQHQMAANNHAMRLEEQLYLERFGLLRGPMPINSYPGLQAMSSMPGARYPPELLGLGPDVLAQANAAMQQRIKAEEEHRHRERVREEERTKKEASSVNRPLATVPPREGSTNLSHRSQERKEREHNKSKERPRDHKERDHDSHSSSSRKGAVVSLPNEATSSKTSIKVHPVTPICATTSATPILPPLPLPPSSVVPAAILPSPAPIITLQPTETPSAAPEPRQINPETEVPALNLTTPVIRNGISNSFSIDAVLSNTPGLSCRPIEDLMTRGTISPTPLLPSPKVVSVNVETNRSSNLSFLEGHKWPWEMLPNHAAHHEAFSPWHRLPSQQPINEGKSKLDLLEEKLRAKLEERKRKRSEMEEESDNEDAEADSLEEEDVSVSKTTRDWPLLKGPPENTTPSAEQRNFLKAFALVTPTESCDVELRKCRKRLALHRELSPSPEPVEVAEIPESESPVKTLACKSPAPTAKRRFFENLQLTPAAALTRQALEMNWLAILADRSKRQGQKKSDPASQATLPALQVEVETRQEATPSSSLLQIAAAGNSNSQEGNQTSAPSPNKIPNIASWLQGLPSLLSAVPFSLHVPLPDAQTSKHTPADNSNPKEDSGKATNTRAEHTATRPEDEEEEELYRWMGPEAVIEAYLQHQQEKEAEKRFLISRLEMLPLRLAERQAHLSSLCLRLSALVADQRKLKEEEESHTKGLQTLLAQWQRLAHHVTSSRS